MPAYVFDKETNELVKVAGNAANADLKDMNVYSTEEKIVGTWIDGKPIYRKVLVTSFLINGEEIGWGGLESNVTSLNIDNCVSCFAIIEHNGMRHLQFIPDHGGFISYYSGIPNGTKVVMEYTKTTD